MKKMTKEALWARRWGVNRIWCGQCVNEHEIREAATRKNAANCSPFLYSKVIKTVCKKLREALVKGECVSIPYVYRRIGLVRTNKRLTRTKSGKIYRALHLDREKSWRDENGVFHPVVIDEPKVLTFQARYDKLHRGSILDAMYYMAFRPDWRLMVDVESEIANGNIKDAEYVEFVEQVDKYYVGPRKNHAKPSVEGSND